MTSLPDFPLIEILGKSDLHAFSLGNLILSVLYKNISDKGPRIILGSFLDKVEYPHKELTNALDIVIRKFEIIISKNLSLKHTSTPY